MSKHVGRKSVWTEVSATKFVHSTGYVELNSYGMWDAVVVFKERAPLRRKGLKQPDRPWTKNIKHCGEYKRARQAMIAVEENTKKLREENNLDRLV